MNRPALATSHYQRTLQAPYTLHILSRYTIVLAMIYRIDQRSYQSSFTASGAVTRDSVVYGTLHSCRVPGVDGRGRGKPCPYHQPRTIWIGSYSTAVEHFDYCVQDDKQVKHKRLSFDV